MAAPEPAGGEHGPCRRTAGTSGPSRYRRGVRGRVLGGSAEPWAAPAPLLVPVPTLFVPITAPARVETRPHLRR